MRVRAELALVISMGTAAIFFGTRNRLVENITHPVLLMAAVFLWLFRDYSLVCNLCRPARRLSCH
jgi:hypothetical protein